MEQKERNTFKKSERLCSKNVIDRVFQSGRKFNSYPIRTLWLRTPLNTNSPVQVLISVSKRTFPKAVDRNRIKRQMREAYRKNKHQLYGHFTAKNEQVAVVLIYYARELLSFDQIEAKIILSLQRLIKDDEQGN